MPAINKIILLLISITIPCFKCYAQSDTIVDQIKYNHIKYYENNNVNGLGNYKLNGDKKIKNGAWVIFDHNSNIIAKGQYRKDKKNGYWIEK